MLMYCHAIPLLTGYGRLNQTPARLFLVCASARPFPFRLRRLETAMSVLVMAWVVA